MTKKIIQLIITKDIHIPKSTTIKNKMVRSAKQMIL